MRESQTIRRIIEEGREEGRLEHAREIILMLLRHRFGTVPQDIQAALSGTSDLDTLDRWILSAASVSSLDDFRAAMK